MKSAIGKLLFIIAIFQVASVCASGKDISVGILLGKQSVKLGCTGTCIIATGSGGRRTGIIYPDQELIVTAVGPDQICYGEGSAAVCTLLLKISPVASRNLVKVNGRRYRGYLMVRPAGDGSLNVINVLDIEQYLYGVIKEEMYITSPLEALKAQAVVARTFAIRNMERHAKESFNVCSTTHCQVYGGVDSEDEKAIAAVRATSRMVLCYGGEPIKAFYTSECGGHTENSRNIWGGEEIPYLKGVKCDYCQDGPNFNWKCSFRAAQLAKKLGVPEIFDIVPEAVAPSGRLRRLKIIHPGGNMTVSVNDFRLRIGPEKIKSSYFTIGKELLRQDASPEELSEQEQQIRNIISRIRMKKGLNEPEADFSREEVVYHFLGRGYGHGVGLCQWGARNMAAKGFRYQDILKYYYPGVYLKKWNY